MMWPQVLTGLLDRVEHDAELVAILGGERVYHLPDIREYVIPMVGYTVVTYDLGEVFEIFTIQWDIVAPTQILFQAHDRLLDLAVADTPREIGGYRVRMIFEGGRTHPQPQIGVQRNSFDVRYEVMRERYFQR